MQKYQTIFVIFYIQTFFAQEDIPTGLQRRDLTENQQMFINIPKPIRDVTSCNCKKIDSGEFATPYQWNSNHPMVVGSGARQVNQWINFSENFSQPPKITTSLGQIDSDHNINLRVGCRASNINSNRFMLEIYTWADTKLYSAICNWVAHGY